MDERDALLVMARPEQVDARMISAAQVEATLANLATLRGAGMYTGALAYDEVGEIGVWAEWTHEQNDSARVTAVLPGNGTPAPLAVWSDLVPEGWTYNGDRIVQWDTPIPPPEGHEMVARMSQAFTRATMYKVGESYLGKTTWAMGPDVPRHRHPLVARQGDHLQAHRDLLGPAARERRCRPPATFCATPSCCSPIRPSAPSWTR